MGYIRDCYSGGVSYGNQHQVTGHGDQDQTGSHASLCSPDKSKGLVADMPPLYQMKGEISQA